MSALQQQSLDDRLKQFAIKIVLYCAKLNSSDAARIIARQLIKSGTLPGAQYREARRAKSDADLVSKLEGCLQELEESRYWLEILVGAGLANEEQVVILMTDCTELIKMLTAAVLKVKARQSSKPK